MSKVNEIKQAMFDAEEEIENAMRERVIELQEEIDSVRESLGEKAEEAKGWLKANMFRIGQIAFALVIGFALGAALV
jgi:Mg2+ and Co2+ transporter CorA